MVAAPVEQQLQELVAALVMVQVASWLLVPVVLVLAELLDRHVQ